MGSLTPLPRVLHQLFISPALVPRRVRSRPLSRRQLLPELVWHVRPIQLFRLTISYSWYKREEFGKRAAIFFSAATVSGAFGGLLAAAISKMEGIGGKPAWAWIFILEGLATVLAGVASFWIIQDFPDTAKFLSEAERTWNLAVRG